MSFGPKYLLQTHPGQQYSKSRNATSPPSQRSSTMLLLILLWQNVGLYTLSRWNHLVTPSIFRVLSFNVVFGGLSTPPVWGDQGFSPCTGKILEEEGTHSSTLAENPWMEGLSRLQSQLQRVRHSQTHLLFFGGLSIIVCSARCFFSFHLRCTFCNLLSLLASLLAIGCALNIWVYTLGEYVHISFWALSCSGFLEYSHFIFKKWWTPKIC